MRRPPAASDRTRPPLRGRAECRRLTNVSVNDTGSGYVAEGGDYRRDSDYITDRITADGSDGWPVEPGRYRLVVARACPWANRAVIVRRLLGLEPVISMGMCGPTHDERSWTFDLDPGGRDPVLGYERLQEAFLAVGLLYVVTSAFTLAKCVRDAQDAGTVVRRVDQARMDKLLAEHDPYRVAG